MSKRCGTYTAAATEHSASNTDPTMANGIRSWRAIRLALRTRPLQSRNTAVSGVATSAAVSSRRLRPSSAWMTPLRARYSASPPIQSSPLNVLRTLSGLELPGLLEQPLHGAEKLSTATKRNRNPMMPRLVLVPEGGAKMSVTASAPPPVSS